MQGGLWDVIYGTASSLPAAYAAFVAYDSRLDKVTGGNLRQAMRSCCDDPFLIRERMEPQRLFRQKFIGNGKHEYYKCENCGSHLQFIYSGKGELLDHRISA